MDIPESHFEVIRELLDRLGNDVDWALTGSTGHRLQGVPVDVNDIDVQTDEEGVHRIEENFSDCVVEDVEFVENRNLNSYLGELEINGVEVEIMGELQKRTEDGWEEPVDVTEHRVFVEYRDVEIPVLSLEYEVDAYRKMGRKERAETLKRYSEK